MESSFGVSPLELQQILNYGIVDLLLVLWKSIALKLCSELVDKFSVDKE